MRRIAILLLLAPGLFADEDPRTLAYKRYVKENIKGHWANEPLSEQRVILIRGLQRHDVPLAARWLMLEVIPKDKAADVVRAAVRVLSKFKSPYTVQAMASIYKKSYKRLGEARALTLQAFGRITLESADGPLALGLKDKDPRVVAAACRAVGLGRKIRFAPELLGLLKHKHRAVRGAAALGLAELRSSEAMPSIFRVFCSDPSHRVRYDAWMALKRLSLQNFECAPDAWQQWWEEQAGSVPGDVANPWGTTFPRVANNALDRSWFFGIPVLGDRIVFVLDASLRMNNAWKVDHAAQRKRRRKDRIPNFFSVKTRWDLVRSYVNECLKGLPDRVEVAFVFYNHEVALFPDTGKFIKLKKKTRASIAEHLANDVRVSGSTAMYEGLKAGWGFLKEGNPAANFRKGCDTLVFVTNGQPSDGELKNKPDRLRDEVWRIAVTRHVRVHAVGLHNHAFALLQGMAKDSGGLYVHAQEPGDAAEPQDLEFWPEKKKAFEKAKKARR